MIISRFNAHAQPIYEDYSGAFCLRDRVRDDSTAPWKNSCLCEAGSVHPLRPGEEPDYLIFRHQWEQLLFADNA
jgi:hypothetical protein